MRKQTITGMGIVVAVAFAVSVPPVATVQGAGKQMGYCFDVAFHEKTSRLFVAGGDKGTHVFDVADGKLKFVTTIADGGYHRNLKISGERVYLADADRGLVVYDITGTEPRRTWQQQNADGMGVDVCGDYVYLAAGGNGLQIFDISTPDSPQLVGACKTNADAWDVWANGRYAYVADLQKGITVVDISQPGQPKKGSSVTWDEREPMAEIVRGEGRIVCVGAGKHGLVVVDISDPQAPKVVGKYKSGEEGFGEGLCIRNGLVYLANGNDRSTDENGLILVDARNPHALRVRGKCTFPGWVEGVCLAGHQAFVANTHAGIRSIDVGDPDHPRLTDSFGPAQGNPVLTSDVSPREQAAVRLTEKTQREILEGRKFNDLSTVGGAFLTYISAIRHEDEALLLKVAPVFADFKLSSGDWSELLDNLIRPAVVRRIDVGRGTPRESDLCSVYTSDSPNGSIGQVWTFGYVEGAWRFLNCTVATDPWMSIATKQESRTREILQKGAPQPRSDEKRAAISEEIAVVTGVPLTAEILDWDISLQTDLANNRLAVQAACTVRNEGPAPLDHLDFDLLAAEKFYGMHVEIAKVIGRIDGREEPLAFTRFAEQQTTETGEAGTHECPLVTRISLPAALEPGQNCRLAFEYTLTCPDITQRHHYNPIWEPEQGKKQVCLIADFTWFPDLATDLQERMRLSNKKNFFLRGSKPAWRVTLAHPAELEGMVIDGRLEKSEQAGSQTVSQWKSIVGGKPQVFIGPAERIEKKGEKASVVFLLPQGKYDPEFVDAVGDLVIHAYSVYTDWFGPIGGNEVHIVSPAGIRGGHGAFLGMTIDASYFRTKRSERLTESGKFFAQTPVHELAHCWWPESYGRGTKFLRESLGNFATWHLARECYGMDIFTSTLQKDILARGQGAKPLFNTDGDEEQFAYEKGPLILDMLRQEMGNDLFFQTLREYVRRYKDGHATFIDFVSVCNEVSQRDWMPFFYHWCYARGYPAYHLVGFESKEGQQGWETAVTIHNSGVGIVRCPLELRMDNGIREESFAVQGGREKTFLYRTEKQVTGVAIDPRQTVYQEDLTEKRKSPVYLVRSAGYGRASNRELASSYDKTWLEQLADPGLLLKTGFALYDVKRYEEALAVFERMEELTGGNPLYTSMALLWQGHMLDLLEKHEEAIPRYEKVAAMGLNDDEIRHDQLGIVYKPSPYAKQRIDTPFTRVENMDEN